MSLRRVDVSELPDIVSDGAHRSSTTLFRACCIAVLLLTAALYLPGLHGYYEFDDYPNIVENDALHVTTLDPSAWIAAMWASPASDLQRPLASLSFAANFYLTGPDPWPMKATNLAIHLLNGVLLMALLLAIVRRGADGAARTRADAQHGEWLALLVAGIWLLHPINLTAVLFIVQRMESLAQTFVLVGLLLYVQARIRQQGDLGGSTWRLWIGVPGCTLLGIAAKESAALLPLYALLLEATVLFGWRRNRRELAAFYLVFLLIPAALGLAWMIPHALAPAAYAQRAFTLQQRLLTEPRVLLDYIEWILVPLPKFFTFFHDDYPPSKDLWHPWTTVPAILLIAAMIGAAFTARRRRPLVALGILWFFAAHVLTASFFPLELVFEHRNYFASIGLLLAALDLVLPGRADARMAVARKALIGSLCALCALGLALRAREWSDPLRLAIAEVAAHPDSPRATYELGRTYVVLSEYRKDSPNVERGLEALERAARVPRATILPEVALIMTASRTDRPIKDVWWESLHAKLLRAAPTVEDSEAIKSLTACQRQGLCRLDDAHTLDAYLAALTHTPPDPGVLYSYAIFAFNRLHDADLATRLARNAAETSRDPRYRINLVNFLLDTGRIEDAKVEIDKLRSVNRLGALDSSIRGLEQRASKPRSPNGT
jgi:hypothetical protein